MNTLRLYLNSLPVAEQQAFAKRAGTSVGYLRKLISLKQSPGAGLAVNLARESQGALTLESLRSDVDWAYVRNGAPDLSACPSIEGVNP
jgi:DNA-binding transcriptional regulator YdaS (Cro superfamily)